MAKGASLTGGVITNGSGMFRGVRSTREPFDDTPDFLQEATNIYLPDPESGCAAYARPGFQFCDTQMGAAITNGRIGQGVFAFVAADGTVTNLVACGGTLYTVDAATFTVFTATSVTTLCTSNKVGFTQLGGKVVITDGASPPFVYDVVANTSTPIGYDTPVTLLSASGASVAYSAFTYTTTNSTFDITVHTAVAGTAALAAGTIPVDTWGVYRFKNNTSGVVSATAGAANFTTGYASEAAAIAAVPSATTVNDRGYITVKTAAGQTFVGGTDGLQGTGVGAHPASATHYYAPSFGTPWAAYGPPTIYEGSVFFILSQVAGVGQRTSVVWSEPNQPTVGYFQTNYNDTWTITQSGVLPLTAIRGTNVGLFYARESSWGRLTGTPSVDFQGQSTGDVVAQNIGCTSPWTVDTFSQYLYFADQYGRPQRFAFGGSVEAIWLQMRQNYDDAVALGLTAASNVLLAFGCVDPRTNTYLVGSWATNISASQNMVTQLYGFDAATGLHCGYWTIKNTTQSTLLQGMAVCGILRNSANDGCFAVIGTKSRAAVVNGYLWVMSDQSYWADGLQDGGTAAAVGVSLTTPWLGYSLRYATLYSVVRIAGYNAASSSNGTWSLSGTGTAGNESSATLTWPSGSSTQRLVETLPSGVGGRGLQLVVTQSGNVVASASATQVQISRIEADGVMSLAGNGDD